jgi:hypothetical protein
VKPAAALLLFGVLQFVPAPSYGQEPLKATVELGSPSELKVDVRYHDPSELFARLKGSRIIPIWVSVKNISATPVEVGYRDVTLGLGDPSGVVRVGPVDAESVPKEFRNAAALGPVLRTLAGQGGDWAANPFSRRLSDGTLRPGQSKSGFVYFLRPESLSFTGVLTLGTTAHASEILTTAALQVTTPATRSASIIQDLINGTVRLGQAIWYGQPPFGKSYAVLFGVSDYDAQNNLPFVASDLTKMSDYLQREGFDKVVVVANKGVTVDTLRNIQEQLRVTLGPDDRLLVYYAGHGARVGDRGYIVLAASRGLALNPKTDVPMAEFMSWMSAQPVKQLLVILDACYSGSAVPGTTRDTSPIFEEVDRATLYRLSSGKGKFVMMAGTDKQLAHEGRDWNGGLFTYAILSGLQDKGSTAPGRPIITTYELYARAKRLVLEQVRAHGLDDQIPLLKDLSPAVSEGEFVFAAPR